MSLKRVLVALGFVMALVAVAVYSYFDQDGLSAAIAVMTLAFTLAVVSGIVIRLIKAKRGTKFRTAFSPVGDAADVYQSFLLGRDSMRQSIDKALRDDETDRFTGGP